MAAHKETNYQTISICLEFLKKELKEIKENQVNLEKQFEQANKELGDKIEKTYVTKIEFDPIKRLVYGAVGTILLAVLGALITLVIRS